MKSETKHEWNVEESRGNRESAAAQFESSNIEMNDNAAVWRIVVCEWGALGDLLINGLRNDGGATGRKLQVFAHHLCKHARLQAKSSHNRNTMSGMKGSSTAMKAGEVNKIVLQTETMDSLTFQMNCSRIL